MTGLAEARAWDAADPLRAFRRRFLLPEGMIYLDGNSLGPLTVDARTRLNHAIDNEWGEGLIGSWNAADWIAAPARIGAKIARLIGAAPNEVVVADSTSINLFKALSAAVTARPGRPVILTEEGNFPTDLYVAKGLSALLGAVRVEAVPRAEVAARLDADVAVLMLTHVHYKSGARWDMAAMSAAARAAGALSLWDLSHSAGAVAVDLGRARADLAVGCGYKFLNGGPGAPAYLFAAERLQADLVSPLTGWMGHAAAFDFSDAWRPAAGMARFLTGTPPVLALAALEAGIDLWLEADLAAAEAKGRRLWTLFADRMEARLGGRGFARLGPDDPAARGSQIAYAHPEAYRIMQALIARRVVGDFRDPDILRFGLTPLYVGFEDVWRAVETLYDIMESEAWRAQSTRAEGPTVT